MEVSLPVAVRPGEKRGDLIKNIHIYLPLMLRVHSSLLKHSLTQTCNTTVTIPKLGLPRNLRFKETALLQKDIFIFISHYF